MSASVRALLRASLMRVATLLAFAVVGFQIAACGGAEEPRVIVEKEYVPVPASSANTAATGTDGGTGGKMPTSLNDPAAKAACDSRTTWNGTFVGTGALKDYANQATQMVANPNFVEHETSDGQYVTTIAFLMNQYGARWTDDVHGRSLATQYYPMTIGTLPSSSPRTDAFAIGKAEPVDVSFGLPTQLVCAEDGSNVESGSESDDDSSPPPATSLTITKHTGDRLGGTLVRGTDTLTFEVALGNDQVPNVCCLGD